MTNLAFLGTPLPSTWDEVTVADVTSKVGSGATPRGGSAVYVSDGPSFIRSQNVYDHEFHSEGLVFLDNDAAGQLRGVTVNPGDVLLNITGDSILRTCLVPDSVLPARVNQHVAIVRSNGRVDPIFLQKWLSLPAMKDYMLGHSAGGTRKAITKGHILSFPVPLPPIGEQRAIAAALGALDDKIESNLRAVSLMSDLLDAMAEQAQGDLGLTPLSSLVTVSRSTAKPERLTDPIVDHYSLPAYDDGARPERVSPSSIMSNKTLVEATSILVSRLNPRIERFWWAAPQAGVPALASTEFAVLVAGNNLELAAAWLAVRAPKFREVLPMRITGTSGSHQRVRPDDLMAIEVPDTRNLSTEMKQTALALLAQANQKRSEISDLAALRDALMPELFSGRIQVPAEAAS